MNPDRLFSPEPTLRQLAREIYEPAARLPIVSPHGHVDPRLFADPNATFGSPTDLFILPDHYNIRMLYSKGIQMDTLLSQNHQETWKLFCDNFHLFRGTLTGIWLIHELSEVFGIDEKPSTEITYRLYDAIAEKLASVE